MSLWLTEDELATLTGYTQRSKQREALEKMGFKPRVRIDGFPLVERAAVLTVRPMTANTEPNWDALRA